MLDAPLASVPSLPELRQRYAGQDGLALLEGMIKHEFPGRIALVSSFGTEAAVLLALAAEVDPALPIIFLDTGKHFGETLRYRDQLTQQLGLTDVRSVGPDPLGVRREDQDGMLWSRDPDACCFLRKVLPLRRALEGFDAWITGRKQYQGGLRRDLSTLEAEDGGIKVNPLAKWTADRIETEFAARGLPRHPLEADGFLSIGCMPCTDRVAPGETQDRRAGRWAGRDKTECGIHAPLAAASGGR
ncbi:MAG: phosphoadenylyl-sulfate reductase [Alphaproteobacteria bacterium]|nr:phosphoadenylyl-sulfate reductase [Alphaproteobacteria bacterium]